MPNGRRRSRSGGGDGGFLMGIRQAGNTKRVCLLGLHYACLTLSAICSVCSASRSEAWTRLACGVAGATMSAAGGPAGLDFALSGVGGGAGNVNELFGASVTPVLEQLASESKAWSSIGWLLAAASVTTCSTLVTVVLKKFCGRARALAMTFLVAALILISTAELISAIVLYLAASQRLRALFDSVALSAAVQASRRVSSAAAAAAATAAATSVSISGRSDGPSPAGLGLAIAAALACLSDLALLALKRLAFSRQAASYDLPGEGASPGRATLTLQMPPAADANPMTANQQLPPAFATNSQQQLQPKLRSGLQSPPQQQQPAVSSRRLTALAGASSSPSAGSPAAATAEGHDDGRRHRDSLHTREGLRRKLERRQESERRRQPPTAAAAAASAVVTPPEDDSSSQHVGGGYDNLAMSLTSTTASLDDVAAVDLLDKESSKHRADTPPEVSPIFITIIDKGELNVK